jgi:hypothetical protein
MTLRACRTPETVVVPRLLLIPRLEETLGHLAFPVNLHEFDLHAGNRISLKEGNPPFRMFVDAGHSAGFAFFEDGSRGQRPLNRGVNIVDGEAGVMQSLTVGSDELRESVVWRERLAKLNLDVAEIEVSLT